MRIHFERSGGFAGMLMTTSVDTESLPPSEAQELQQMVETADFFSLPASSRAASSGANRFQYKVTVEAEGRQHTIELGEADIPDELWPLLRRLTTMTRSSR